MLTIFSKEINKKQKIQQLNELKDKFVALRNKVKDMLSELSNDLSEIKISDIDTPLISKGRGRPRKPQPVCEPEFMRLP